jgi:hypothetical protein
VTQDNIVKLRITPSVEKWTATNEKPKVIIVAVMRKMITTLNAMVRDNAAWHPRAA